jgi:hypothetical protein
VQEVNHVFQHEVEKDITKWLMNVLLKIGGKNIDICEGEILR